MDYSDPLPVCFTQQICLSLQTFATGPPARELLVFEKLETEQIDTIYNQWITANLCLSASPNRYVFFWRRGQDLLKETSSFF